MQIQVYIRLYFTLAEEEAKETSKCAFKNTVAIICKKYYFYDPISDFPYKDTT